LVGWTCVCLLSISNRPAHRTQRVHEPLPHGCCVLGRTRGIVVNTPGCLQGMRRCDLAQHRHSRFPRNIPEVHRDPIESPDPTPPTPRCARWSEGREFGAPKEGTSKKSSRNRHRCARCSSLFPADLSLSLFVLSRLRFAKRRHRCHTTTRVFVLCEIDPTRGIDRSDTKRHP
jgi:hypothetical protein